MRIAFISPGNPANEDYRSQNIKGKEDLIWRLCQEFTKRGHNPIIVRRWHKGPSKEEIKGVKVVNINSPSFGNSIIGNRLTQIVFSKHGIKKAEKLNPDILNLTANYSSFFACKSNIPTVHFDFINPVDLTPAYKSFLNNRLFSFLKKRIEDRIINNSDLIVVRNLRDQNYFHRRGKRTVKIPTGIKIDKYQTEKKDENFIFFGGRLHPAKGVRFLLKAYSLLEKKLKKKFELIIGGEGVQKEKLRYLTRKYGIEDNYKELPWLSKDLFIKKMAKCSVFVLPSLYEGMPISVIEAMALEKPVLASNTAGSREIISDGKDGFIFERQNVNQLKELLSYTLKNSDIRSKIGERGRKKVQEKFTFDRVSEAYLSCYENLLRKN